jgi:hypothetical protein
MASAMARFEPGAGAKELKQLLMIPTYTKPSKTENKSKLLLNVTS